jgi:hypothetical protein
MGSTATFIKNVGAARCAAYVGALPCVHCLPVQGRTGCCCCTHHCCICCCICGGINLRQLLLLTRSSPAGTAAAAAAHQRKLLLVWLRAKASWPSDLLHPATCLAMWQLQMGYLQKQAAT